MILTLILVIVLASLVVVLLSYVSVGFKTSSVATERTDTNADSANVMNWAIEQFAKKQLVPTNPLHCGEAPTYVAIPVDPDLVTNGSSTVLDCAQTNPITGEPVVHLRATSTGDQTRVIEATVEVAQYSHGARVSDWRVDIPIAVPDYVTTTTIAPTTTTTVPGPNQEPEAFDMEVWVNLDDAPFVVDLHVSDPDGDTLSIASIVPDPELDVSPVAGTQVTIAAPSINGAAAGGSYSFTYTVQDTAPLVSNTGTVLVHVNSTPTTPSTSTTTTTTLAPAPSCQFRVTTAQNGGNTGIGELTVSNAGGDFSGWEIRLNQLNSAKPWQFTWGPGVTATVTSVWVDVAGSQTVTQSAPFTVTADLTQANGTPKIVAGNTLTCTVVLP